MTTKVFVLLSGGADSSTTLALACHEFPLAEFEAVTINYGQRHIKEAESAAWIANHFGAEHVIVNLQGLMQGMLVDKGEANEKIPDVGYEDLPVGISPTYVSFRNGLMLSVLAARAQAWVMSQEAANQKEIADRDHPADLEEPESFEAVLYCGVHADDGVNWAYPDCTPEFVGPMGAAIYTGTYNKVRLRTPLLYLTKAGVIKAGLIAKVPFGHTWSCYKGEELQCGICPTCRSRRDAFKQVGAVDPTEYGNAY